MQPTTDKRELEAAENTVASGSANTTAADGELKTASSIAGNAKKRAFRKAPIILISVLVFALACGAAIAGTYAYKNYIEPYFFSYSKVETVPEPEPEPEEEKPLVDPSIEDIKMDKTIKKYDLDGDGEKDSFKVNLYRSEKDQYYNPVEKITIDVNGDTLWEERFVVEGETSGRAVTLPSGVTLIELISAGSGGWDPLDSLYCYYKGKVSKALDTNALDSDTGKVFFDGDQLKVGYYRTASKAGSFTTIYSYELVGNELVRKNQDGEIRIAANEGEGANALVSMPVYTDSNLSKQSFTLEEGTAVTFTGARIEPDYWQAIKLETEDGEEGWIDVRREPGRSLEADFTNCLFAG